MAREMISNGSTGDAVTELQQILSGLGYNPGPIDGVFGAATEAGVRRLQEARGITADGVVGNDTWAQVDANVAEANAAQAAVDQAAAAKAAADAKAAVDAKAAADAQAAATAAAAAAEAAAKEAEAIAGNAANMSSIMEAAKEAMGSMGSLGTTEGGSMDSSMPL